VLPTNTADAALWWDVPQKPETPTLLIDRTTRITTADAADKGFAQVKVTWAKPDNNGGTNSANPQTDTGAPVIGYKMQIKDTDAAAQTQPAECVLTTGSAAQVSAQTCTIKLSTLQATAGVYKLTDSENIEVRVAATNAVGDSAWSDYSTAL